MMDLYIAVDMQIITFTFFTRNYDPFLRRGTEQRRYVWRASIDIYLALYHGVKTAS